MICSTYFNPKASVHYRVTATWITVQNQIFPNRITCYFFWLARALAPPHWYWISFSLFHLLFLLGFGIITSFDNIYPRIWTPFVGLSELIFSIWYFSWGSFVKVIFIKRRLCLVICGNWTPPISSPVLHGLSYNQKLFLFFKIPFSFNS